jgi:hypothetical protein
MAGLAFTGWLFFDSLVCAAILALFAIPLEKKWLKSRADARRKELAMQLKDLLFSLSASFRPGVIWRRR